METSPPPSFQDWSTPALYFDGSTSNAHPVVLRANATNLILDFESEERLPAVIPQGEVRLTPRIGNAARFLQLDNGGSLQARNNNEIDELLRLWNRPPDVAYRWESSVRRAAVALLVVCGMAFGAFRWGIPYAAQRAAYAIPDELAYRFGSSSLETLDKLLFSESELDEERVEEIEEEFDAMAELYPELPLTLVFRSASMANAFALPDGTIVVTDKLVTAVESDDELFAVLAHEIGHIHHRHSLRLAIESSIVALVGTIVFGDASQGASLGVVLPTALVESQYSQKHETEADTFALEFLKRANANTEAFAKALEHLEAADPGGGASDSPSYFSSHPPTPERIARFRKAPSGTPRN